MDRLVDNVTELALMKKWFEVPLIIGDDKEKFKHGNMKDWIINV